MKVICIDAGDIKWCIDHGMIPLKEGNVYTIRAEVIQPRGEGYLLMEIINDCNVVDALGIVLNIEPSYSKRRFIPLSTIDETENVFTHKLDVINA